MWSHSSILQKTRSGVTLPATMSCRMRSASLACTCRRISSGCPGMRTVDQRLLVARAEASDAGEIDVGAAAIDGFGKCVVQAFRAVAPAAGSHADGDARHRRQQLVHPRFANRVEGADVLDARHHSLSRSSDRTSRCRVRSFT